MTKGEERSQLWQKRLNEFEVSEKTKEEWCKEKKIHLNSFNYWFEKRKQEKVGTEDNSIKWLSVDIQESKEKSKPSKINIRIGKAVVEIDEFFDTEMFAKVIKILGETVC